MARPKKETVDYFPHFCNHGKTMMILESKWGNDGYAFWFKLLEVLGNTRLHAVDMNCQITAEFLYAKTRLDEETATSVLDILAKCGAIDADLWINKIIYSPSFVSNISDAYTHRKGFLPTETLVKESFGLNKSTNESKVNETRVNEITTPPKEVVDCFSFDEVRNLYRDVFRDLLPSVTVCQQLGWIAETFDKQTIIDAFTGASSVKAKSLNYILKPLRDKIERKDADDAMWAEMEKREVPA
jgi:hypothetical protein